MPFALEPDAPLPDGVGYASCVCRNGVSAREFGFPPTFLGVEVGRPFGFEVQIEQEPGRRSARGALGLGQPLARRARTSAANFRFESPRFNGAAVLAE